MGTLDRACVAELLGAMDFSDHPVIEEGSLYSPQPKATSCDEYVNPQSACSAYSLASEGAVEYGGPVQEQTPGLSHVPCFTQLLENDAGDDDGGMEGSISVEEVQSYTDLSTGSPYSYVHLRDVINPRQQPFTVPQRDPKVSCSADDQIPIPCFDNNGFKPCSTVDDLDLVAEAIKDIDGDIPFIPVKQEPLVSSPVASTAPSGSKRKFDESHSPTKPAKCLKQETKISEAERIRRERRKASNRRAAKKCREKKLKEQNAVIQAKEDCEAKMERLMKENAYLRRCMSQCRSCCHHVPDQFVYTPELVHEPS